MKKILRRGSKNVLLLVTIMVGVAAGMLLYSVVYLAVIFDADSAVSSAPERIIARTGEAEDEEATINLNTEVVTTSYHLSGEPGESSVFTPDVGVWLVTGGNGDSRVTLTSLDFAAAANFSGSHAVITIVNEADMQALGEYTSAGLVMPHGRIRVSVADVPWVLDVRHVHCPCRK